MNKPAWWWRLALIAILIFLASCRAAPGDGDPIAENVPTATGRSSPQPTLPVPGGPPAVENDAPAGICEDTANILSRVDRASGGLFRAVALDNRVGANDGDGIRGVRFAIAGEDVAYTHDEVTAPYCIFGSNEPDCGDWPRDADGRYTWGVGGPVVRPGRYQISVEVVGESPDSLSGSDRCDWSFTMVVELR